MILSKFDIILSLIIYWTFGLVTTGTSANMHTGENLVVSVASGNPVNGNSQVVIDVMYRTVDMP